MPLMFVPPVPVRSLLFVLEVFELGIGLMALFQPERVDPIFAIGPVVMVLVIRVSHPPFFPFVSFVIPIILWRQSLRSEDDRDHERHEREERRMYDPYHKDYHNWDDREDRM